MVLLSKIISLSEVAEAKKNNLLVDPGCMFGHGWLVHKETSKHYRTGIDMETAVLFLNFRPYDLHFVVICYVLAFDSLLPRKSMMWNSLASQILVIMRKSIDDKTK